MDMMEYRPKNKVRFVTATSLFDGHDVSINLIRRFLVEAGAEVIHLGHNRSAGEIVSAAIQEDAQAVAVSSYQGGHMMFYKYIRDLLDERGAGHIKVFGGGGGVIIPREIKELGQYGIKIYSPEDGRRLGLSGMIEEMVRESDFSTTDGLDDSVYLKLAEGDHGAIAKLITLVENSPNGKSKRALVNRIRGLQARKTPVIGITGTGGAGKSSVLDEIVWRILERTKDKRIAIISVDPTRTKTGGALLGDRIRMNHIQDQRVYMRSLATRGAKSELSRATRDAIEILRAGGFDLIFVETGGIGQGDTEITKVSDVSLYVMTPEYGAALQLEKIDMLDYADIVVINKFERRGAWEALRDVRKQFRRNHGIDHSVPDEDLPIIGTIASRFNDIGVNALYGLMVEKLREKLGYELDPDAHYENDWLARKDYTIIPRDRENYLSEIAKTVRDYKRRGREQVAIARRLYQLDGAIRASSENSVPAEVIEHLRKLRKSYEEKLLPEAKALLEGWDDLVKCYSSDTLTIRVRDKQITHQLYHKTLSGTRIPKIALPKYEDYGERLKYLWFENVPGRFPFTGGTFPLRRTEEEPRRQFAGEGGPERTNKRFHYLTRHDPMKRLSVAFDSPTLYGEDPDERPDIYGKIGEGGVSICTLDDMKRMLEGFDLCHPLTSVSMTINGPAPVILAMFFNTAIDQQIERFRREHGREPTDAEREEIKSRTLQTVRGTVQADILKEDQGQNTCIFSIDFALRLMGDVQEYFIQNGIRNFYSVSISGYHIAEAGANPITQLAFTLANGFTYVEYYLSRGMKIDDFAPNLSFFFSNGMDPEYSVLGRVARRIWAIAMRERYHGNERSQKLKYHIQTSGRSLHAQEMAFNDIRTTLQALIAYYDNCNSLHTNSYDEAVTTPTEESVRRAVAIQLIVAREFGLTKNENISQGSFIMEELTDLVEEAVLAEFERISERGGVLGAMELGYQRGRIQEESMVYEMKKHSGELPIIGVNTFVNPDITPEDFIPQDIQLARATEEEKRAQLENLRAFQERNKDKAREALERLKRVAQEGGNIFAELMEAVKYASLGQITHALYEIGGRYRRNM
ncbi:MAG: fused isobutyryl-CoA mutase/GTPase IcmF [candidate division WOR-3 bacterium]